MSYPFRVFSLYKQTAGGDVSRILKQTARGLASIALLCIFLLVPDTAVSEQTCETEPGPVCSTLEQDPWVRNYIIWPLIFVDETAEWRQFSFVPFYVERKSVDDSERRVQVLWPIYMYRRSGLDISIRIVPFYAYWKDVYEFSDGEEYAVSYMLFPFIYGNETSEEGRSFAVFPIAGKLNNFLGQDQTSFFLFPLYMEYRRGELHQRNFLWPILSFSEGGRYSGFRLWPLFGYFGREGEYRNDFVLWPIYGRKIFDLDKEQPGERVMFFPFFAREDSSRRRYRAILWPFFSYEQNFAQNFEEHSMPWPFIVIRRGDVHRTQLWPLYMYKRDEDREIWHWLWPLLRREEYEVEDGGKLVKNYLVPFIYDKTETAESGEIKKYERRFWPLWRFRRDEDGSTYFRTLSLLWFADEPGFERQYTALWTIYERAEDSCGDSQTRALWGLVRHTRCGSRSETRIPLLYSRISDSEQRAAETRILGGLISGVRESERLRLRLLNFGNRKAQNE